MISAYVRNTEKYVQDRHYWLVGMSPEAAYEALALVSKYANVEACVYISGVIPDEIKYTLHKTLKEDNNEDIVPHLQGHHMRLTLDTGKEG